MLAGRTMPWYAIALSVMATTGERRKMRPAYKIKSIHDLAA